MDKRIAEGVIERDRYCLVCGRVNTNVHLHHRKLRKHGGPDTYPNLIAIHDACHTWVHHHPETSYDMGYLVHSWADPAEVTVTMRDGNTALLTHDGDAITLEGTGDTTWAATTPS